MQKFTVLEGVAAPLPMINVDTDKIIPKGYLKTIKRTGLGQGLFAEIVSRYLRQVCLTDLKVVTEDFIETNPE